MGFSMKIDVISTKTENVKDNAKAISNSVGASGKIKITSMQTMPSAKAISDRLPRLNRPCLMSCADGAPPTVRGFLAMAHLLPEIVGGGRNVNAFFHILFQLVAQSADGNAQNVRRVRAVAQSVL